MNVSGPLTDQEKANAKEIFEALDQDGDGKISHDDLKQALINAGFELTDEEVEVSANDFIVLWHIHTYTYIHIQIACQQ